MNNRLSAEKINQIREEVAVELGMVVRSEEGEQQAEPVNITPTGSPARESRYIIEFSARFMEYDGVEPSSRPHLPKLEYNKTTTNIIKEIDKVISEKLVPGMNAQQLYSAIYAGALATLILNGQKIGELQARRKTQAVPPWQKRLELKITKLRKDIGILTQSLKNTASVRVKRPAETITKQHQSTDNPTVIDILDLFKQILAANAKKLRRYKTSHIRKLHKRNSTDN